MKFCTFWSLKWTKWTEFRAAKMAKTAIYRISKILKLISISRKIWMTEKSCNFHIVKSMSKTCLRIGLFRFGSLYLTVWRFHDFSIIKIYMKSILENLEVITLPFLLSGILNFVNWVHFSPTKVPKNHKSQNSEPLNVLKRQISHFYNPPTWFHVKSEW